MSLHAWHFLLIASEKNPVEHDVIHPELSESRYPELQVIHMAFYPLLFTLSSYWQVAQLACMFEQAIHYYDILFQN